MNIEQMAYDAGLVNLSPVVYTDGSEGVTLASLQRFAALVRAQALEEAQKECEREMDIRTQAGKTHPEDSASRDRCFAAARAARNCVEAIRALKSGSKPLGGEG